MFAIVKLPLKIKKNVLLLNQGLKQHTIYISFFLLPLHPLFSLFTINEFESPKSVLQWKSKFLSLSTYFLLKFPYTHILHIKITPYFQVDSWQHPGQVHVILLAKFWKKKAVISFFLKLRKKT